MDNDILRQIWTTFKELSQGKNFNIYLQIYINIRNK